VPTRTSLFRFAFAVFFWLLDFYDSMGGPPMTPELSIFDVVPSFFPLPRHTKLGAGFLLSLPVRRFPYVQNEAARSISLPT